MIVCGQFYLISIHYLWTEKFFNPESKVAYSKISGYEWTGPKINLTLGQLVSCNMVNKRDSVCSSGYPNTEKREFKI